MQYKHASKSMLKAFRLYRGARLQQQKYFNAMYTVYMPYERVSVWCIRWECKNNREWKSERGKEEKRKREEEEVKES